ncbi:MAG: hypothetical protein E1N59_656 [Puniceicoccaceae bacterium 5H]|nr:MAG: hypothetical protein E1N59_656 [Puniceicoccaceae bacterium 5H]
MSDLDYLSACHVCGVESHDDAHEQSLFCAALYEVTEDADLKAALEDQREEYEDMSSYAEEIAEALSMDSKALHEARGSSAKRRRLPPKR